MPESPGQMTGALIPQRVAARPRLWQRTTAAVQRVFRMPVWLLGVAGLGLLVAGVIRIVAISNGAGLVTVVVAGAVVALVKARPPLLITVYCGGLFVFMFVSNNLGFKPRFVSWAFPALIAVAAVTRRRGWQPIAIAFAMLLPVVFLAYATLGNYMIQP